MMITRANLNSVTFENEDARRLILDVVSHTSACLYYYDTDIEITVSMALKIWDRAYRADRQSSVYSVSFMDAGHMPFREPRKVGGEGKTGKARKTGKTRKTRKGSGRALVYS